MVCDELQQPITVCQFMTYWRLSVTLHTYTNICHFLRTRTVFTCLFVLFVGHCDPSQAITPFGNMSRTGCIGHVCLTQLITKYQPLNAKSDGHLFSSLKLSHYQGEKSSVRIKKSLTSQWRKTVLVHYHILKTSVSRYDVTGLEIKKMVRLPFGD